MQHWWFWKDKDTQIHSVSFHFQCYHYCTCWWIQTGLQFCTMASWATVLCCCTWSFLVCLSTSGIIGHTASSNWGSQHNVFCRIVFWCFFSLIAETNTIFLSIWSNGQCLTKTGLRINKIRVPLVIWFFRFKTKLTYTVLNEQWVLPWVPPPSKSTHSLSVASRSSPACSQSREETHSTPPPDCKWMADVHGRRHSGVQSGV